jgi:uncharacterized membrane protein required for colicin V production
MHNITDYITLGAFLYFFFNGWRKGFLRTRLGPISLIVGCFIGYGYYQKTQNVALGLGICIIGPFIINILASLVLKLWHKAVNSDIPLSIVSRLSASALSILWSGSYLVMMMILIAVSPLKFGWFEKTKKDVLESRSYAFINARLGDRIPPGFLISKKLPASCRIPKNLKSLNRLTNLKP